MADTRRCHHVVPVGYQRGFSQGKQIRLVAKDRSINKTIGIRDNFVERDFLSGNFIDQPRDAVEIGFSVIEGQVLPLARSIDSLNPTAAQTDAVKHLFTMLYVRSYKFKTSSNALKSQMVETLRTELKEDQALRDALTGGLGRPPTQEELDSLVDAQANHLIEENGHFAELLTDLYPVTYNSIKDHTVSIYSAVGRPYGFITSDNPVLLASDPTLLSVSVAWNEGRIHCLPISRWFCAALTTNQESQRLSSTEVVRINNATWRNAIRFVAAHPDENWATAAGVAQTYNGGSAISGSR